MSISRENLGEPAKVLFERTAVAGHHRLVVGRCQPHDGDARVDRESTLVNTMIRRSSGTLMLRNRCQVRAPSTRAASSYSLGMLCKPAR
jgi:hypothetical protein